ncbi:SMP-30/gluconolactonase/LRE family protein [Amycolatopsis jejuensis]|uniref:SMP-30/gluconolactonase/LRE family protein n=1 Tax=Amycolatopsis jejuensis TaxID=330084 RepID=UPI000525C5A7|nr:SMP-30/gluconolactonase/LRE family protein [Amycolatopsis jejuensis]
MTSGFDVVVAGLAFPEAPRWHDGALWFSDIHDGRVYRQNGALTCVAEVPGWPSGLGFLPDGRLLVVSMTERRVLRLDPDGLACHADLTGIATWHTNDLVVDRQGRAYIGNHGDGSSFGEPARPADLALVGPSGTTRVAASGLSVANGMVLLDDERTLAVAETRSDPPRVTLFDVGLDGTLANRRPLITLDQEAPDGLAVDPEGNVWVASPLTRELLCVTRSGRLAGRMKTGQAPLSCVFGGARGTTLFVCESDAWGHEESRTRRVGRVTVREL